MSKLVTTRAPVVMGAVIANGINATTNIGAPSLVVNGAPGSNAGNAYGVSGGPGGSAVGYNNGDGVDRRFATYATGGAGGAGASGASSSTGVGGPAGAGGASGYASAGTNPGPVAATYVKSYATATGGAGGGAGVGGIGKTGNGPGASPAAGATAAATATAIDSTGPAFATATASGGSGGSHYDFGFTGGAGGGAYIGTLGGAGAVVPGVVYAKGTSAHATAKLNGGNGGSGLNLQLDAANRGAYGNSGPSGGAGASSTLINGVSGVATNGSLYLSQTAIAGTGGSGYGGQAGAAGNGASTLVFTDSSATPATVLLGSSAAQGGNGGGAGYGTNGKDGGTAASLLTLTGSFAVNAVSTATGGGGGSSGDGHRDVFTFSTGNGGNGGLASVVASAVSGARGSSSPVLARATAVGGYGGNAPFSALDAGVAYGGTGNGGTGGAVNLASATALLPAASTNMAQAYTTLSGGRGGAASGAGKSGGAGGAVSGGYAEASGFSALASVTQRGGSGGDGALSAGAPAADAVSRPGASGGAGADSLLDTNPATHTYAVKAIATGGVADSRQFAYGGAGGSGANGVSGGAPGGAVSTLIVDNLLANGLSGESSAHGGAGGGGAYTTSGATGGAATAVFNESGAHSIGTFYYGALAVGGTGGATNGTGTGGKGGTAYAKSAATSTTTLATDAVASSVTSTGGAGGANTTSSLGNASGGTGGAVTYTNAQSIGGQAHATASARGGAGGAGQGAGHSGGAGGQVSGTYTKANSLAVGAGAYATATQVGGAGGLGQTGAAGGDGANSTLTSAVNGSSIGGRLTLRQTATGGAGGDGALGGSGGNGNSNLTFNDNQNATRSTSIYGTSQASGGAGGIGSGASDGAGGVAVASISLTGFTMVNSTASATGGASLNGATPGAGGGAIATAIGSATSAGVNGTASVVASANGGSGATQGTADSEATAITAAGQMAQATSTAAGLTDIVASAATTSGPGATGLTASTSDTGGGTMIAISNADIGGAVGSFQGAGAGQSSYAFETGLPTSSYVYVNGVLTPGYAFVPALLTANPAINAKLGGATATVLGYGIQGSYSKTSASGVQTLGSTTTYTVNTTGLTGYLIAGLVGEDTGVALGTGFTSLTFTATVNGTVVGGPHVFTTAAAAQTFFTNDALNLGGFKAGANLVVALNLTLVTSVTGEGFGASILLGTSGGSGPPIVNAPATALIGQSHALGIPGISVSETGAVAGEAFAVTVSDLNGLLTASPANGAYITGSGTPYLYVSGSLAQVNAALATLSDSDSVTPTDTISIGVNDTLGGTGQGSIAVSVNGQPAIAATATSITADRNIAATLTGLTLVETGTTTGETFTATLSDQFAQLAATQITGGAAVTGEGSNNLTIAGTFAQVNAALATVSEVSATIGADQISLGVTDSLGATSTPASISMIVVGSPTIAAPGRATVAQGASTPISGVSLSETGDTSDTFSVTVQDKNGLLSITSPGGAVATGHSLTINGSLSAVNTRLATLSVTDNTIGLDTIVLAATNNRGVSAPIDASIGLSVNAALSSVVIGTGANPVVASLGQNGGSITIYQATSNGIPSGGIFGQIFNAGVPVGNPFPIDPTGTQPTVIVSPSGGQFMVAWVNGDSSAIQGQVFDPTYGTDGALLSVAAAQSTPLALATAASGTTVYNPNLAVGALTPYSLAYQITSGASGATTAAFQPLDSDGTQPSGISSLIVTASDLAAVGLGNYQITDVRLPRLIDRGAFALGAAIPEFISAVVSAPSGGGSSTNSSALSLFIGSLIGGAVSSVSTTSAVSQSVVSMAQTSLIGGGSAGALSTTDALPQSAVSVTQTQTAVESNGLIVLVAAPAAGLTYGPSEIAGLANGDLVAMWEQIVTGDLTWSLAGQIVTPTGQLSGARFVLPTALPASGAPVRPTIDGLADGGFVVTYSSATSSLSGQKFDASGDAIGGAFLVSSASQGDPATTVLSDGTLLSVTGGTGGSVSAQLLSVAGGNAAWTGASGTDLGTAGNWQPAAIPDTTETLIFGATSGGLLTGTVGGLNAVFSGIGAWFLQGSTLTLAGEAIPPASSLALSDFGDLTVSGGSIVAAGSLDIETGIGVSMAVLGGAQVGVFGITLGMGGGQTGSLAVSGTGTTILNSGASGLVQIGGGGSGAITVNGGAKIANAAGAILGVSAGGNGSVMVSGVGTQFDTIGEVDVGMAGAGDLQVENGATLQSGGNVSAPSQGFDVADAQGGSGDVTISGSSSVLTNLGRFVIGDAGVGSLAIEAGATVVTNPGAVPGLAGAVIGNTTAASDSFADVSGSGSNWQVSGLLDIGVAGSGALNISGGGVVSATSLDTGNGAAAVGNITLSGSGTKLIVTGAATVADDGTGVLSVLNGASFSAQSLTIGSQGDSSGALVISGANTTLTVSGQLNIGTALGTGDLTVGPGAVVDASVVNLQGGVVLEGGLLDPTVFIENGGSTTGGFGTVSSQFILLEGTILSNGSKSGKQTEVVQGTVVGGGTATIGGTASVNSPGILQMASHDTIEVTGAVLNAASTTFTDNLTPTGTYTVNNSVIDVVFQDGTGVLKLDDIAGFGGTIATWSAGDQIIVTGGTLSNIGVSNGNTLTVADSGSGAGAGGTDTIIFGSPVQAGAFNIVNGTALQAVACFAAGTRIRTQQGDIRIEDLSVGDRVVTVDGEIEPIVWIGKRAVNCRAHPRPETVWPVRVRTGAFAENVPVRDLYLSPDHAVFVNDMLVPAKLLIDGIQITQVKRDQVAYYHVELPRHAIILADDLPVESYLDLGDRANFDQGHETIRLFPDLAARLAPTTAMLWETRGVAPLVMRGEKLAAARRAVMMAAQAGRGVRSVSATATRNSPKAPAG